MPAYNPLDPAPLAFIVIPLLLAVAFIWVTFTAWRRSGSTHTTLAVLIAGGGTLVWMSATWFAAASGILLDWDRNPPPFAVLVASIVVLSAALAFGPFGTRVATQIPLWTLVAVQAFRLPLELAMHGMYDRGIMPVQMSYSGLNFDILTGATALPVAFALGAGRGGRLLVITWNILGFLLLVNVVVVAILGTPRFRFFGDAAVNTWVTHPPFVWLPAVMVLAALAGHLVIFRALASSSRRPAAGTRLDRKARV